MDRGILQADLKAFFSVIAFQRQGTRGTVSNTDAAGSPAFVQTAFFPHGRIRCGIQISDDCTVASAAAYAGNQHIIDTKSTQTGQSGNMPLGLVTDQFFTIKGRSFLGNAGMISLGS